MHTGTARVARTVVENRQARHLYYIEETFEAGLQLEGWEVKAALAGQATFNGGAAYVKLAQGEAFLDSLTITALPQARAEHTLREPQALRPRKLLLKRAELDKLNRRVAERGYTVVPLALTYGRKLKLTLGLARGKKLVDKKETIKQRDEQREQAREVARLSKG